MDCVKLAGQDLMAKDFDRQVAAPQFRITVLKGYTALGRPATEFAELVRPVKREVRSSPDLCNTASPYLDLLLATHDLHENPNTPVGCDLFNLYHKIRKLILPN